MERTDTTLGASFQGLSSSVWGRLTGQTLRRFTSSDSRILVTPAHISNGLNDKIRLIALDEVSTFFREPKLPML